MLNLTGIDYDWTLFLDRDGVINREKDDSYVFNRTEFHFNEGALEALKTFDKIFHRIVIATNQRGVERKLMTEADLADVHLFMMDEIKAAGGRIDRIYYCTSMDNSHPNRKPNPGMAFEAAKDYPEIILQRSIMIGNNLSDMEFGRNAGMHTVLLTTTGTDVQLPHPLVDLKFSSLFEFAQALTPTPA